MAIINFGGKILSANLTMPDASPPPPPPPPPTPTPPPVVVGTGAPTDIVMIPRMMYTGAIAYNNAVGDLYVVGGSAPTVFSVSSQSTAGALRIENAKVVSQGSTAPTAGAYTVTIRATNVALGGFLEKQFSFSCVAGDGLWLTSNVEFDNNFYGMQYGLGNLFGNKYLNSSDIVLNDPSNNWIVSDDYTYIASKTGSYAPPGDYPLHFTSVKYGYDNTFIMRVIKGVASTAIYSALKTVSSVAKIGQVVGTAWAWNQDENYGWTIPNSDGGNFNAVGNADGTVTITVARDNPPVGSHTIRLQVENLHLYYSQDITFNVVQGTEYASTNLTMTVLTGLTNYTAVNTVIGTPSCPVITGTVTWALVQNDGSLRWACDPNTGVVTNPNLLSAYPEDITLVAGNGTDVCRRTFTISATETTAWTEYHCGPGQKYAQINDAAMDAFYGGVPAKIMIHASPNVEYYMGDNGGYGGHQFTGGAGPFPICYIGVVDPTTGALPIVGGGGGYFQNGFITCGYGHMRDTRVENLEITRCYVGDQDNGQHLDGIAAYFGGMLIIRNCHIRNNDMGILANMDSGSIFIYDSIISRGGDAEPDRTHNIYGEAYRLHMERVISYGTQIGHNFKSRSNITECIDCVFVDGEMGRSSSSVNIPNGTDGYFLRCQFQKGPGAEQANIIRYGEEHNNARTLRPVQRMVFDDCEFINHLPGMGFEPYGDIIAIKMSDDSVPGPGTSGGPVISPTTGLSATVSFTNCRMFGVPSGRVLNLNGVLADPASGITYLTESPPLRMQTKLLNGALGRAVTGWKSPRHGSPGQIYSNGQLWRGDSGMIDVGVHEIRMLPSAPAGAIIARVKMWGSQAGLTPYVANTTWSLLGWTAYPSGTFLDPNFRIVAETDGTARIEQITQHAAGVYWLWPRATAPDGVTMADQPIYIVCSTVAEPANEIPAALISYP